MSEKKLIDKIKELEEKFDRIIAVQNSIMSMLKKEHIRLSKNIKG